MSDPKPLPRVYSNALSTQSYVGCKAPQYTIKAENVEAPNMLSLYLGADLHPITETWSKLPMRGVDAHPGCDPFGMHAALSFEPMDENCFPSALSRGSRADAELLPLSSSMIGAAMLEPFVFMPPAGDFQPDSTPDVPEASAHRGDEHDVQGTKEPGAMGCLCCVIDEDAQAGRRATLGALATLQDVTVGYMEETGRLDITLERAAESMNVSIATLKVHMKALGIRKWPSRKRCAIRKLLCHSPDLQGSPCDRVSHFDQTIGEIREALVKEYKNFQCPTPPKKTLIRDLRQRWYKSPGYRQRQQMPPFGTRTPSQTTPPRPTSWRNAAWDGSNQPADAI